VCVCVRVCVRVCVYVCVNIIHLEYHVSNVVPKVCNLCTHTHTVCNLQQPNGTLRFTIHTLTTSAALNSVFNKYHTSYKNLSIMQVGNPKDL